MAGDTKDVLRMLLIEMYLRPKLTVNSDKPYNYLTFPDPPSPNYGVPAYPRCLNGYYTRLSPNGGVACVNKCLSLGFKIAGTNDDQCCMFASFVLIVPCHSETNTGFRVRQLYRP